MVTTGSPVAQTMANPPIRQERVAAAGSTTWKNWLVGSMAGLALLMSGWYALHRIQPQSAMGAGGSLQQQYEALQTQADSIGGYWLRTLNPLVKHVEGDLVWNNPLQQGVMRIRNLPAPPAGGHYRLWLYDAQRPDISQGISVATLEQGTGDTMVYKEIRTDVPVGRPYKFALKLHTGTDTQNGTVLLAIQP